MMKMKSVKYVDDIGGIGSINGVVMFGNGEMSVCY